jgi:hypothetical protein
MTVVAPWREHQTQVKRMFLSHDHPCRYKPKEDFIEWQLDGQETAPCRSYAAHSRGTISGLVIATVQQF